MTNYSGVTWRVNYGEISERNQFRVGRVGMESYDAYFEVGSLVDLISVLNTVNGLSLGQVARGTAVQARKVSDGLFTSIRIEPRLDTGDPVRIMVLPLADLPDFLYALVLFQTDLPSFPIADDWDFSKLLPVVVLDKNGKVPDKNLPDRLSQSALDSTFVNVTGDELVAGVKTFSSAPVVPDASFGIPKVNGLQGALDDKAPVDVVYRAAPALSVVTKGLYARTQPTPGGYSFRALAKDPNQNGANGTGRVWGIGTQFAQIGFTDDDGATWTVKSANFQSGVSIQQMKFSASYLWIVTSQAGSQSGNVWRMPLPDVNGNFPGIGLGTLANLWGTTVSAASNGVALPQATINITNGNYFAAAGGTATVITSVGPQIITYTGKTAGTLTGCSGGTGTMTTGANVLSAIVRVFGLDNLAGGPGSATSAGGINSSFRNSCFDINTAETAAWVGEYGTGNVTYQFPAVADGIIAAGGSLLYSTSMVASAQMVGLSITVSGAGLGGTDLTANVMEVTQLNDVSNPAALRLSAPARTTVTAANVTFPSTTYGAGNIPGGPSVYRCTNPKAAAGSVVWTKDKTFQQGKHIHAVKFFGGLPHVGIGDLSKQFKDCGIWVANSATAPTLWIQRSLAPTGTIPKDPINMVQVTIDGKDALACESDSSFYDGPMTYTDATGTGNRVLESQCKIPAPYTQTMRGLTLDVTTGNLIWFGTSEGGALGPTSCIWMSRAPYVRPLLLEDVGSSMDTETVGDSVISNGYAWFGTRRIRVEQFLDQ